MRGYVEEKEYSRRVRIIGIGYIEVERVRARKQADSALLSWRWGLQFAVQHGEMGLDKDVRISKQKKESTNRERGKEQR